jgi:single-stranded-DNA-specific exonuclease
MEECHELLLTHGGHAMAAGLSLREENLEAFRRRMVGIVARQLTPERLSPSLRVDEEVSVDAVTKPVVRELERLAPHGAGNPVPLLVASHVRVAGEPRLMGKKNGHLSLYLKQESMAVRAVGFGMGDLYEDVCRARTLSVAFTPQINEWQGRESVELHLKDVRIEE